VPEATTPGAMPRKLISRIRTVFHQYEKRIAIRFVDSRVVGRQTKKNPPADDGAMDRITNAAPINKSSRFTERRMLSSAEC
jgi:hypothetical protein